MKNKRPMFVFNEHAFTNNLLRLQNAFKQRMVRFKVGYSFKTNPHPLVLKTALDKGCYAEVVSPYEYESALRIGFTPDRIIYNGVCKDSYQASECAKNGGIVNVDSIAELIRISCCTSGSINVGARLTFDDCNGISSRFGIPINSDDYLRLIDIANDMHSGINIVGISCHITKARSVEDWKKRAEVMMKAAKDFKDLKYIDLGGNMFSPMTYEYSQNFTSYATFDEYAKAIAPYFKPYDIDLILEPGTPLIANAVDLVCNVIDIKKNGSKTFVVVDISSFDIGISCKNTRLPITIPKKTAFQQQLVEGADVVGYTCIEDDVLYRGFTALVSRGDQIIFHNVGAYSVSFASDFIMPAPDFVKG